MEWSRYLDYGTTAAALVVVSLVVKMFLNAMGNHMSWIAEVLQNLVVITQGTRDDINDLKDDVRGLR